MAQEMVMGGNCLKESPISYLYWICWYMHVCISRQSYQLIIQYHTDFAPVNHNCSNVKEFSGHIWVYMIRYYTILHMGYQGQKKSGVHFTNNFSIVIQIWWKIGVSVTLLRRIILLQNLTCDMTALHYKLDESRIHFTLNLPYNGKIVDEMGPWSENINACWPASII